MKSLNSTAILGALVADSASLGLHWVYDPARIAEISHSEGLCFFPLTSSNYSGDKGLLCTSPQGRRRFFELRRGLFVNAKASGTARRFQSSRVSVRISGVLRTQAANT